MLPDKGQTISFNFPLGSKSTTWVVELTSGVEWGTLDLGLYSVAAAEKSGTAKSGSSSKIGQQQHLQPLFNFRTLTASRPAPIPIKTDSDKNIKIEGLGLGWGTTSVWAIHGLLKLHLLARWRFLPDISELELICRVN